MASFKEDEQQRAKVLVVAMHVSASLTCCLVTITAEHTAACVA